MAYIKYTGILHAEKAVEAIAFTLIWNPVQIVLYVVGIFPKIATIQCYHGVV